MGVIQTIDVTSARLPQVSRSGYVFDDWRQLCHAEEQEVHETYQGHLRFGKSTISK